MKTNDMDDSIIRMMERSKENPGLTWGEGMDAEGIRREDRPVVLKRVGLALSFIAEDDKRV